MRTIFTRLAEKWRTARTATRRLLLGTLALALLAGAIALTIELLKPPERQLHEPGLTLFPAGPQPDHIVQTFPGDTATTRSVTWRTDLSLPAGLLEYVTGEDPATADFSGARRVSAESLILNSTLVLNDPQVMIHRVRLDDLQLGSSYAYRVGNASPAVWSEPACIVMASPSLDRFSFLYLGDAQRGLARWGELLHACRKHPAAATAQFCILAGDLVEIGGWRDNWDEFFAAAGDIFASLPLAPVIGNHDTYGRPAISLYRTWFDLPADSPVGDRAWVFSWENAFFLMLDSNLRPQTQLDWADEQLAAHADAQWKFVVMHHPLYYSGPGRENPWIRQAWEPVFERHGVDIVFQGHDHGYMRTQPLRAGKTVAPEEGIVYIVSVSGQRFYDQRRWDGIAEGFTDTPTWQAINIDGPVLHYECRDESGTLRDSFTIDKINR